MEYDMATRTHWTERSVDDFVHRISSDFVVQLEERIEDDKLTQKDVAERLGVTGGAVSQTLNSPGNLELKTMVQYARAVGMKLAVVAYDDNDPRNEKGPIISEIFAKCWERLGKPQDFFELDEMQCWIVHGYHHLAHTADERQDIPVKFERYAASTGEWRRRA
jgi:transcriptional regulator with XRE-family HTH domain